MSSFHNHLFSTISTREDGLDIPLEYLYKGVFHKLLVMISFKEIGSNAVQISKIRVYSIELTDIDADIKLSMEEENDIKQNKEQIRKYIENIHKKDNKNVVYLGISLLHNAIQIEELTKEQYDQLVKSLYDELRETCPQRQEQESQEELKAKHYRLQQRLKEIDASYNKLYELEMQKLMNEYDSVCNKIRDECNRKLKYAAEECNKKRHALYTRIQADEEAEIKALKKKIEPNANDELYAQYEKLLCQLISSLI